MKLNHYAGVFGVVDFLLILLIMYGSTFCHEAGHALLATALGGEVLRVNLISFFPSVDFTATAQNAVYVHYFGGLFSASIMIIPLIFLNKRLEQDRHFILKAVLLAIITWQISMGILEGWDFNTYSPMTANNGLNVSYLLFLMPSALVLLFYFVRKMNSQQYRQDQYQH